MEIGHGIEKKDGKSRSSIPKIVGAGDLLV